MPCLSKESNHINLLSTFSYKLYFTLPLEGLILFLCFLCNSPNPLNKIFLYPSIPFFSIAPRKSKPSSTPSDLILENLIKEYQIPNFDNINHLCDDEENKWRYEGVGKDMLVLGQRHINTIRFLIHPLIIQFITVQGILTLICQNFILNEVKNKTI